MKLERRISEIREENREQLSNERKQHKEHVENIQKRLSDEKYTYEIRYFNF